MAINKYRFVAGRDGGHDSWQCLMCGDEYMRHGYRYTFCPHCGTCWEGEHEWDQDAKRAKKRPGPREEPLIEYEIEDRCVWPTSDPEFVNWRDSWQSHGRYNKQDVLTIYRQAVEEAQDSSRFVRQYRLIAITRDGTRRVISSYLPEPTSDVTADCVDS